MASLRGERFHIPLDDGEDDYDAFEQRLAQQEEESANAAQHTLPPSAFAKLVGEIKERESPSTNATVKPPLPPTPKSTSTGFPEHRKRVGVSRFKSRRQEVGGADGTDTKATVSQLGRTASESSEGTLKKGIASSSGENRLKREIDEENKAKLSRMSASEISEEQKELMKSLSPSLIQRLLQRPTIDNATGAGPDDFPIGQATKISTSDALGETTGATSASTSGSRSKQTKRVTFEEPSSSSPTQTASQIDSSTDRNGAATASVTDSNKDSKGLNQDMEEHSEKNMDKDLDDRLAPASVLQHPPELENVHFPQPSQPPELDPSDPAFLDNLHEKYFPSLPTDPSKLAWMNFNAANSKSYDPDAASLPASQLRFGFRGELLAPRTAQSIPVTIGLHHHGDAPESAGYTVRELAHLSRSSVPTQRCIAFQILGRLMYRLGKGEYGDEDLCKGLWRCVEEGRVLDTLQEEIGRKGGHMSAKAYASDALWLWQRGGGKSLGAG